MSAIRPSANSAEAGINPTIGDRFPGRAAYRPAISRPLPKPARTSFQTRPSAITGAVTRKAISASSR
jgi:hypothetical protein